MKQILLTQGRVALVDDADYEILNHHKWYATEFRGGLVYAMHRVGRRKVYMHRLLLGLEPDDKRVCDHIDGDGTNNQRSNLRICTATQNNRSRKKQTGCSSKYKGVSWDRQYHRWRAHIQVNKKTIYLGRFDSESDAARVYDKAALQHFGEYARTNQILGLP